MKTFKIILVGPENVGKSTFVKKLCGHPIAESYSPTLGVNVIPIRLQTTAGEVCFNIWDCAGNKAYKGLGEAYYSAADAAIIMLDVANTFNERCNWTFKVRKMAGTIPMVHVGNKYEALTLDDALNVEKESQCCLCIGPYFSISCKTDYNLYKPLLELSRQLLGVPNLQFIVQQPLTIENVIEMKCDQPKTIIELNYNIINEPKAEAIECECVCTKCKLCYKFDSEHSCERIVMKKKKVKRGYFSWLKFW